MIDKRTGKHREPKKESKGLWQTMYGQGNIVKWSPDPPLTIDDISKAFEEIRKQDIARRERMDKEYTDISKIKIEELEEAIAKYGDDIPRGLMVKVKWGGQYTDVPIKTLYNYMKALGNYAKELYEKQQKDGTDKR